MLTPEQIDLAIQQHVDPVATYGRLHNFARAIEAEVRKQDTELIRQMLEALETCDSADGYNGPYQFHDDKAVEAAITAGRARLAPSTEPASNLTRTENDRL